MAHNGTYTDSSHPKVTALECCGAVEDGAPRVGPRRLDERRFGGSGVVLELPHVRFEAQSLLGGGGGDCSELGAVLVAEEVRVKRVGVFEPALFLLALARKGAIERGNRPKEKINRERNHGKQTL